MSPRMERVFGLREADDHDRLSAALRVVKADPLRSDALEVLADLMEEEGIVGSAVVRWQAKWGKKVDDELEKIAKESGRVGKLVRDRGWTFNAFGTGLNVAERIEDMSGRVRFRIQHWLTRDGKEFLAPIEKMGQHVKDFVDDVENNLSFIANDEDSIYVDEDLFYALDPDDDGRQFIVANTEMLERDKGLRKLGVLRTGQQRVLLSKASDDLRKALT